MVWDRIEKSLRWFESVLRRFWDNMILCWDYLRLTEIILNCIDAILRWFETFEVVLRYLKTYFVMSLWGCERFSEHLRLFLTFEGMVRQAWDHVETSWDSYDYFKKDFEVICQTMFSWFWLGRQFEIILRLSWEEEVEMILRSCEYEVKIILRSWKDEMILRLCEDEV